MANKNDKLSKKIEKKGIDCSKLSRTVKQNDIDRSKLSRKVKQNIVVKQSVVKDTKSGSTDPVDKAKKIEKLPKLPKGKGLDLGGDDSEKGINSGDDECEEGTNSGNDESEKVTNSGDDESNAGINSEDYECEEGTNSGNDESEEVTNLGDDESKAGINSGDDELEEGTNSGDDKSEEVINTKVVESKEVTKWWATVEENESGDSENEKDGSENEKDGSANKQALDNSGQGGVWVSKSQKKMAKRYDGFKTSDLELPEKYVKAIKKGLREFMEDGGWVFLKEKNDLIQFGAITKTTADTYGKHFKGLYNFAGLIGDYGAMLMLSYSIVDNYHYASMNPETIAHYLEYKSLSSKTLLPIKDVLKRKLYCKGDPILSREKNIWKGEWKDPGNLTQCLSAVSKVHASRAQTGQYFKACKNCAKAFKNDTRTYGCSQHGGMLCVHNKGNPRTNLIVKNAKKACKGILNEDYVIRGCRQMKPADVLALRMALLSTGKLGDLQLYCMCLIGIFLFLRSDEVLDMKVDHFLPEISIVDIYAIECIGVQVFGKADQTWRRMFLYSRHSHPKLDPMRHLLLYVHLAGIKDGYLFPNLRKKGSEKYVYKSFNDRVKERFHLILGQQLHLTTHVFRKTAYLFAVWANAVAEDIRKCARHKGQCSSSSERYRLDAQGSADAERRWRRTDPQLQVPKFEFSIEENRGSYDNDIAGKYFQNLFQLSQMMLERSGIDLSNKSIPGLIKEATSWNLSCARPNEDLKTAMSELPEEQQKVIMTIFERMRMEVEQTKQFVLRGGNASMPGVSSFSSDCQDGPNAVTGKTNNATITSRPVAKRQRTDEQTGEAKRQRTDEQTGEDPCSIPTGYHTTFYESFLTTFKKVECLVVPDKSTIEFKNLTVAHKTWLRIVYFPMTECLLNHFDGNRDAFMESWGPVCCTPSKFKSRYCCGTVESKCGVAFLKSKCMTKS